MIKINNQMDTKEFRENLLAIVEVLGLLVALLSLFL